MPVVSIRFTWHIFGQRMQSLYSLFSIASACYFPISPLSIYTKRGYLIHMWFFSRKREIRYILSIDGGGMRGIIPSVVLARLNSILRSMGDRRPLYSHFDMIAGTSTGALLALGLASPAEKTALTAENLQPFAVESVRKTGFIRKENYVKGYIAPGADPTLFKDIYIDNGPRIFPSTLSSKTILYPILQDKYTAAPFEDFLKTMLRDVMMKDMLVPTMAVSFDIASGKCYLFRSWDGNPFLAREAARASAAAPMYFPLSELYDSRERRQLRLVDGGLIANNPALLAYSEARKLYPDADEFRILSLSTGSPGFRLEDKDIGGGIKSWASPVIKIYTEAGLENVDIIAGSIRDISYTRIWEQVLEKKIKLDSIKPTDTKELLDAGIRMADLSERKLREYAEWLVDEDVHDSVRLKGSAPDLGYGRRQLNA